MDIGNISTHLWGFQLLIYGCLGILKGLQIGVKARDFHLDKIFKWSTIGINTDLFQNTFN